MFKRIQIAMVVAKVSFSKVYEGQKYQTSTLSLAQVLVIIDYLEWITDSSYLNGNTNNWAHTFYHKIAAICFIQCNGLLRLIAQPKIWAIAALQAMPSSGKKWQRVSFNLNLLVGEWLCMKGPFIHDSRLLNIQSYILSPCYANCQSHFTIDSFWFRTLPSSLWH